MILRPTAFVLGAGASAPYGFPLGGALGDQIASRLRDDDAFRQSVVDCGVDTAAIGAFLPAFAAAGRRSIDAFLQSRPEFHLLAKTAIALHLMPLERDDALYGRPEDWYGYLLDSLCQRTPDDYRANQLSIITFNFDRSLERRIYLTLQASYGISGDELKQLCRHIPIVHVHGQLGTPSWLERGDGSRDYGSAPNVPDVRRCAAEIKIVYDEIPDQTKQRVRDCLRVAEVICFVGFGFHPFNVQTLEPHRLRGPNRVLSGTMYGLEEGEAAPIRQAFGGIQLHNDGALSFLRKTNYIHAWRT